MRFDFLISSERSGSNLITKILDNHSLYRGPSPVHLLRVVQPVLKRYGNLSDDQNWELLVSDVLEFFNCKIGVWPTEFSMDELTAIQPRSFDSIVYYIYQTEAKKHGKQRAFIKEISTYKLFSYLIDHFKEAKFIWLVRDPRDMALSWSKSPVHRGDIVRSAEIWKSDQQETIKLHKAHPSRIHLVKYEDLISNQTDTLKQVCSFLGIDFEDKMTAFHKNTDSLQNAQQTDNWKNLNKEIMGSNAKKYLDALSMDQIQFIEYTCHQEMDYLAYKKEYTLITDEAYDQLHEKLSGLERHEKPEYQAIDESEKVKRAKWHQKFTEIQNR